MYQKPRYLYLIYRYNKNIYVTMYLRYIRSIGLKSILSAIITIFTRAIIIAISSAVSATSIDDALWKFLTTIRFVSLVFGARAPSRDARSTLYNTLQLISPAATACFSLSLSNQAWTDRLHLTARAFVFFSVR